MVTLQAQVALNTEPHWHGRGTLRNLLLRRRHSTRLKRSKMFQDLRVAIGPVASGGSAFAGRRSESSRWGLQVSVQGLVRVICVIIEQSYNCGCTIAVVRLLDDYAQHWQSPRTHPHLRLPRPSQALNIASGPLWAHGVHRGS